MWIAVPNEALYHHGIKGQRWGVRNGPPYPLSSSNRSVAERKARWKRSLSERSKRSDSNTNASTKRRGHLIGSDHDAMVEAGSAFVVALSLVGLSVLKKKISDKKINKDVRYNLNSNPSTFEDLKKIKGSHSQDQDMAKINPGYSKGDPKARMNCAMCTTAYELRRRGYDVKANYTDIGRTRKQITEWFNLDKKSVTRNSSYKKFRKALEAQPEGSRGNVWAGVGIANSSHSMIWEKTNGKIIIRDAQSNEKYDSIDASIINRHSNIGYSFVRTDNATINEQAIMDAILAS